MYYINDHMNSPAALVNGSTGAVAQRYEYDAGACPDNIGSARHVFDADYREEMADQQTEVCTLTAVGFTGQRLEVLDNGGLQIAYYKNRWYDPEQGRFMSQDPAGYVDGLNLYQYVNSNSINDVDIYGLYPYRPEILPPYDRDGYDPREDDDPYGNKFERPATPCPADVCGKTQQEIDAKYNKCMKYSGRFAELSSFGGLLLKRHPAIAIAAGLVGAWSIEDYLTSNCDAMKNWCEGGHENQPYPPRGLFW